MEEEREGMERERDGGHWKVHKNKLPTKKKRKMQKKRRKKKLFHMHIFYFHCTLYFIINGNHGRTKGEWVRVMSVLLVGWVDKKIINLCIYVKWARMAGGRKGNSVNCPHSNFLCHNCKGLLRSLSLASHNFIFSLIDLCKFIYAFLCRA